MWLNACHLVRWCWLSETKDQQLGQGWDRAVEFRGFLGVSFPPRPGCISPPPPSYMCDWAGSSAYNWPDAYQVLYMMCHSGQVWWHKPQNVSYLSKKDILSYYIEDVLRQAGWGWCGSSMCQKPRFLLISCPAVLNMESLPCGPRWLLNFQPSCLHPSQQEGGREKEICILHCKTFFFWPDCATCRILVPWPGLEPGTMAMRALSPNLWTTRELSKTRLRSFCTVPLISLVRT